MHPCRTSHHTCSHHASPLALPSPLVPRLTLPPPLRYVSYTLPHFYATASANVSTTSTAGRARPHHRCTSVPSARLPLRGIATTIAPTVQRHHRLFKCQLAYRPITYRLHPQLRLALPSLSFIGHLASRARLRSLRLRPQLRQLQLGLASRSLATALALPLPSPLSWRQWRAERASLSPLSPPGSPFRHLMVRASVVAIAAHAIYVSFTSFASAIVAAISSTSAFAAVVVPFCGPSS